MHFDTDDFAAGEREAAVREVMSRHPVPVEIDHPRRGGPGIDLGLFLSDLGPLTVGTVRSSATTFTRTRLAGDGSPPNVVVAVQRTGSSTLVQEGREAVIGPGELALVSSAQPSVIQSGHRSSVHHLRIPAQHLAVPDAAVRQAVALRLDPELPVAGVLSRFIGDLAALPDLQPVEAEHLARPTVELVRALVASVVGDSRRARASLETSLQLRVRDYLRMHWHERDLSAHRIAVAHHISTRHVYRLLADQGISLGDWLRERRLEAARDELARPGAAPATVAAVGRRWGFPDATNFGRAFKAAYGLTPREWRQLHQPVHPRP